MRPKVARESVTASYRQRSESLARVGGSDETYVCTVSGTSRHLSWALICLAFWGCVVLLRLAVASDIQNLVMWWITMIPAFSLPAAIGWHLAKWQLFNKEYRIRVDDE